MEEQTKRAEEEGAEQEAQVPERPVATVRTELNEERMLAFNRSQAVKLMWVPFLLTALLAGLGLFYALKMDGLVYGITMVVLGALLPVLYFWLTDHLMKKNIKRSPMLSGHPVQVFSFTEEGVTLHESSETVTSSDTALSYAAFIRAEEKKTAYYLFIGKVQAYILDADGFVSGSREELNALLSQKLASRFKPRKNSK